MMNPELNHRQKIKLKHVMKERKKERGGTPRKLLYCADRLDKCSFLALKGIQSLLKGDDLL